MIHGEAEDEEGHVNGGGENKEWGKGELLSKSSEALLRFMGCRNELFSNGLPNISSILLNFFQTMKDFNGKNIFNLTMMIFNGILSRVNVPRNLIR